MAGFLQWKKIIKHFFDKGICPYQFSFILTSPFRKLILSPQKLADRLHLKKEFKVLEIGPGPGYFSVEVARRISEGHLELLDIQEEMLKKAIHRIKSAGLNNVSITQGDAADPPFKKNEFDVIFLVSVLGEISNKEKCLKNIYNILKPSGLLSITEQPGDPDFLPIPVVRSLAEKEGFKFIECYGKNKNYTLNFRK